MLSAVVFALTLAGLCLAISAVAPLSETASLVPTRRLKRAWQLLSLIIIACVGLQLFALRAKLQSRMDFSDVLAASVHLLGPIFVLTIARLSRATAKDLVRVAGLERAALFDTLTGLPNRRHFDAQLVEAVDEAGRTGRALDLVILDIDHFKHVNDTFGHGTGDLVLKQVANLISDAIGGSGVPYRIGGEEFALILRGFCDGRAHTAIERLRCTIESTDMTLAHGGSTRVTASLGLATWAEGDTGDSLVERADMALYAAKRDGRNRIKLAA